MGDTRPKASAWVDDPQRCAALHPAVAEAARRVGAGAVGLVGVGPTAVLDLQVDRVGITYDDGRTAGDPAAAVQVAAAVRGNRPIPTLALPDVVARIGVGAQPAAVATAGGAVWLAGDPLDALPDALARVPAHAAPIVVTTWALSSLSIADRARFLHVLDAAATDRPVAWASIEGVGVAPAIPTFGDRHASGHSIIGVAAFGHGTLRADAVGRCWSRGRWLSWVAGS
jgi:hypothetical protein